MILTWIFGIQLNLTRETKNCQTTVVTTSCQQIVTPLLFCQFMANLEQLEARFQMQSIKPTFSIIVIFCLTKTEKKKLKNLQHSSHTLALSKGTIFTRKCWFFLQKNADISKIKTLVLNGIFSETTCVGVHTKFQVSSIIS